MNRLSSRTPNMKESSDHLLLCMKVKKIAREAKLKSMEIHIRIS